MKNQKEDITIDLTDITRKCCEQPYANKFDKLDETNFFEKHKLPKLNKKK